MKVRTQRKVVALMWVVYGLLAFGVYLPTVLLLPDASDLITPMCIVLTSLGVIIARTTYVVNKRWEAGLIRCMECEVPLDAVRELETPTHSFGRCPQCKRGYKLEKRR